MKEVFVEKGFKDETVQLIEWVNEILDEHREMGFTLSLRQINYVLIARDLIPNTDEDYFRVKRHVSNGRLAGLIDWGMVVDRLRLPYRVHTVADAEVALDEMVESFTKNKWLDQPYHVEVMAEKDTETGVLWPVCRDLEVPFSANRGYSSTSALYRVGKRLREAFDRGQKPVILYIGDHDPSGLHMDRDIQRRVAMFAGLTTVPVIRLALTMQQIEALDPPPNPVKVKDPRSKWYIDEHGSYSWETAALRATDLADIVRRSVMSLRDDDLWAQAFEQEEEERQKLREHADEY